MDERTLSVYDQYQRNFLVYLRSVEIYLEARFRANVVRRIKSSPALKITNPEDALHYEEVDSLLYLPPKQLEKMELTEAVILDAMEKYPGLSSLEDIKKALEKREQKKEREKDAALKKLTKKAEQIFSDRSDPVCHSFFSNTATVDIKEGFSLLDTKLTSRIANTALKYTHNRMRLDCYKNILTGYNSNTDEEPPTPYELEEAFLETRKKFLSLISTKKEG